MSPHRAKEKGGLGSLLPALLAALFPAILGRERLG